MKKSKAIAMISIVVAVLFTSVYSYAAWPNERKNASLTYLKSTNRLILFGGATSTGLANDFWGWNGNAWQELPVNGNLTKPSARFNAIIAADDDKFYIWGGTNDSGDNLNDLWECNETSCSRISDGPMVPRIGASMIYVKELEALFLFGGGNTDDTNNWNILADLWMFKNGQWTNIAADTGMAEMFGYMFYQNKKLYVVGGISDIQTSDGEGSTTANQQMLVYNTQTQTYSVSDIGIEIEGNGTVATYNQTGTVYILTENYIYTFINGTWSNEYTGGTFPNGQKNMAFANDGHFVYLFGGTNISELQELNYMYKYSLITMSYMFIGPCENATTCSNNNNSTNLHGDCITEHACSENSVCYYQTIATNTCIYDDTLCLNNGSEPYFNTCIQCTESGMQPQNEGAECGSGIDDYCDDDIVFLAPKCQNGLCTRTPVKCKPYTCATIADTTQCKTSCITEDDCMYGYTCINNQCQQTTIDGDEDSTEMEMEHFEEENDVLPDTPTELEDSIENENMEMEIEFNEEDAFELMEENEAEEEVVEYSDELIEQEEYIDTNEQQTDGDAETTGEETEQTDTTETNNEQETSENIESETDGDIVEEDSADIDTIDENEITDKAEQEIIDQSTEQDIETTEQAEQEVEQTNEQPNSKTTGTTKDKSLYSCSQNGATSLVWILLMFGLWIVILRKRMGIKKAFLAVLIASIILPTLLSSANASEIKDATKTKIAILPMNAKYGIPQGVADLLTGQIIGQLAEKKFVVTPMADVQKILEHEATKQKLGCTDLSCYTELGNALGVDYLLVGELGKLGDMFLFSLRLVSVRDGKTNAWSEYLQSGSESAFINLLPSALYTLFPRIFPPPVDKLDQIEAAREGKTVEQKTEEAKSQTVDGFSHDGLFLIDAIGQVDYKFRGMAGGLSLGYGFVKYFEVHVGTIFAPQQVGLRVGWRAFLYNYNGYVKPFGGLMITTFFLDTIPVGVGGDIGVMVDTNSWLGLYLSVPIEYYFSVPNDIAPFMITYMFGVQIRI